MIWVLAIAIFFIFYTFFGYPLLLLLLSKVKRNPQPSEHTCKEAISIVLIACNESKYIESKIKNCLELDYDSERINLIIVDDCSDDNTVALIEAINDPRVTLIKQKSRQGKAAGLNCAMEHVNSRLVMFVDARQVVSKNALIQLSKWLNPDSTYCAVSGEVKFQTSDGVSSGVDVYQAYEKFIRLNESRCLSVPGVSGAIYMMKSQFFRSIPTDTILDDVLIPMVASQSGLRVGFDETVIALDIPSDDMEREKMRKTRTLNGNYQVLFRNLKWCWPLGHVHWFPFLSHKVARLLAPIAILIVVITSFLLGLGGNLYCFSLFCVTTLGLLSYPATQFVPSLRKYKLIKIGSAFVALNWFNVLGFWSYLSAPKGQAWK